MDIYINDEKIDFSLEQERTLGDVIKGIGSWLIGENFSIHEISIDGETLDIPVGSVDLDRLLDGISELRFSASSSLEEIHEKLGTVHEYFSIFLQAVNQEDHSAIIEVLHELPYVAPALDGLLTGQALSEPSFSYSKTLQNLIDDIDLADQAPKGEQKDRMAECLQVILTQASGRIREIAAPLEELKSTVARIVEMVPELSEVSVLLQTGNDRDAMNRVVAFTDLSAKLIRLYAPLKAHGIMDSADVSIEGESLQDYYMRTNEFLTELNEAFENNDSVLIGDLLEYEIAPKLKALSELLDGLS